MKGFPSIKALAAELKFQKRFIEDSYKDEPDDDPGFDVRLQVHEESWSLHTGDSSYDQDHRGFWGAGYLTRSSNCRELAKDLIEEAKDDAAMMGIES